MPKTVAVIGAGAVGLAVAYVWQTRHPQDTTIVLEREGAIGTGTSARSSEVRHTPIHYTTGSLKESLCAEGGPLLDAFCAEHDVPFERTGKFVVATNKNEESKLEQVLAAAMRTGTRAQLVTGFDVRNGFGTVRPEPRIQCTHAVYLPDTAVFDTHAYTAALERTFMERGGILVLGAPITQIIRANERYRIDDESFDVVINAAGLHAVDVAQAAGIHAYDEIINYVKGAYWNIPQQGVHALVYPVPTEYSLGVHFTRNIVGEARLGPGVDILPYRTPAEFPSDVYGVRDDLVERMRFLAAAKRYFPHLTAADLTPGMSGIRPQLALPKPQRDFIIVEESASGYAGFVNLIGIESPGLTASLAIGAEVATIANRQ